jgi:hypothetical protein
MSEQPIAYEEVPGSRTSQQAIDQPQRERIAYEELQPGDVIQPGDEWQHECGRWKPFASLDGSRVQVRHTQRARRAHSITALEKYRGDLIDDIQHVIGEREEARAQAAKLSAELWARKPLEDRVASLVEELAQARAENQQLLKTIAENADQFAEHTAALVRERDEAEVELKRLQDVVSNLYSEPTARQVQDMLRTWATELDWSGCCFDSTGRDKVSAVQRVLIAVIERIEGMINPEGGVDDN